jgi:hypothetical protein
MKKNKIPPPNLEMSYGVGRVCYLDTPDRLSGKLYEVIEAIGLSAKQEEASFIYC